MIASTQLPPTPPALLRIKELARLLDVSTRTIWRFVAMGKLPPPLKFSKVCARWRRDQVEAALDRLAQGRRDGLDDYLDRQTQARGQ